MTAEDALAALRVGEPIECDEIAYRTEVRPAVWQALESSRSDESGELRRRALGEIRRLDRCLRVS